jgi:hypothetical protein
MSSLTDTFNNVTAPLIQMCQQWDVPPKPLAQASATKAAMKVMLVELKAAADALRAQLAAQIATLP